MILVVYIVNNVTITKQCEPPLLGVPLCEIITMNLNQSESIFIYIFHPHHNYKSLNKFRIGLHHQNSANN